MDIPEYEGEMQGYLEAALDHLSRAWNKINPQQTGATWPPQAKDYMADGISNPAYPLAAAIEYIYATAIGMRKQWGNTEGQLCPYKDCCYNLALPKEGWYTCGHCLKDFWCRETEGIEDFHCYLPGQVEQEPPKPAQIPMARVLGKSWATPK